MVTHVQSSVDSRMTGSDKKEQKKVRLTTSIAGKLLTQNPELSTLNPQP